MRNRLNVVEFARTVPDILGRLMTCCHPALWSGRSVAWYARLLGVQEVVSSNLTAPTIVLTDLLSGTAPV